MIKILLITAVVLFVAVQLVPVSRANPAVVRPLEAPDEVLAILKTSCYDCHSNETIWPWYSYVAPMSWLVSRDVKDGRKHLNFSDIDQYEGGDVGEIAEEVVEEIEDGEMPLWFYVPMHAGADITAEELAILQSWAEALEHSDDRDHDASRK